MLTSMRRRHDGESGVGREERRKERGQRWPCTRSASREQGNDDRTAPTRGGGAAVDDFDRKGTSPREKLLGDLTVNLRAIRAVF